METVLNIATRKNRARIAAISRIKAFSAQDDFHDESENMTGNISNFFLMAGISEIVSKHV
jgi:hypothetical protein